MKIVIDFDAARIERIGSDADSRHDLYSTEGFELLSDAWLKVGWNQKYSYTFSWMGRPIIQLPEDMLRIQEVIYELKPDVIVETGVAHGGSLIFYASLMEAMGKGRVVGIDILIHPHNRQAIEQHPLAQRIDLIEGSSTDASVVAQAEAAVEGKETVLVILDSNHTYQHVCQELELYSPFVTPGSYIVVTDGSMRDFIEVPNGEPDWVHDNPARAAEEFCESSPEFSLQVPKWPFNGSELSKNITYWPSAWVKRNS